MISTNTHKPKELHTYDQFMKDVRDEQSGAIARVSSIPRQLVTTPRPGESKERTFDANIGREFKGVNKLATKTPAKTFLQTSDLRDMADKAKRAQVAAEKAAAPIATPKRVSHRKVVKGTAKGIKALKD